MNVPCNQSATFSKTQYEIFSLIRLVPIHELVNSAIAGARTFSFTFCVRLGKLAVEEFTTISTFGPHMMRHGLSMLRFSEIHYRGSEDVYKHFVDHLSSTLFIGWLMSHCD